MAIAEKYGSGTGVRRGSTKRMLMVKYLTAFTVAPSGTDNEKYASTTLLKRSDTERLLLSKELKIANAGGFVGGLINENFRPLNVQPRRGNTLRQLEAKTVIVS